VLLASFLAVSAPAGELGTPGVVAPPPPAKLTSEEEETVVSYGDPNANSGTAETSDYLFFEALAALLSIY